jgi:glycine/D-amino acid oxidase-like deaminating enzyme/nitrite reductase/ring-hydroxylating ferredoxin subunit
MNRLEPAGRRPGTLWAEDVRPLRFDALDRDVNAETVVIGGGLTGVLTAYFLARSGKRVALVEAGAIGDGETGRSTAHVTAAVDFGYAGIRKMHGEASARAVADSQRAAIDTIEAVVEEEKIDCGYETVDGYLFLSPGTPAETLEDEFSASRTLGFPDVELLPRAPLASFDTGPCLRYPRQAQLHPLLFLRGLVRALVREKVQIFTDTHVSRIHAHEVTASSGRRIRARDIVVATHSPIKNVLFFLKEAAYRSYVIACPVEKNSVPGGLYWDTGSGEGNSYHYVRLARGVSYDHLLVGGEDHKTGQADDYERPYRALEEWTRERFPGAAAPEYRWSGQVIEPVDSLAFIGRSPYHADRLYIATGYSGNGWTYGATAASILRDLILRRKNAWAHLYSPTRKNARATMHFLEENLNVFEKFGADRLKSAKRSSESLAPGEGAVVRKGRSHLAVFRDEAGERHSCSAVCPHLGCLVQWNGAEKTFDCPCHGSRFTPEGRVLTGPATRDLRPIEPVPASK